MPQFYLTQAGALALQAGGLPGLATLAADLCTTLPGVLPSRTPVIGDFTPPTYTGYAQAAPTITGGWVEGPGGLVYAVSSAIVFAGPSSGPGADVVGIVLWNGTGPEVYAFIVFDNAVPMQVATDHLEALLQLFEDETANIALVT